MLYQSKSISQGGFVLGELFPLRNVHETPRGCFRVVSQNTSLMFHFGVALQNTSTGVSF